MSLQIIWHATSLHETSKFNKSLANKNISLLQILFKTYLYMHNFLMTPIANFLPTTLPQICEQSLAIHQFKLSMGKDYYHEQVTF